MSTVPTLTDGSQVTAANHWNVLASETNRVNDLTIQGTIIESYSAGGTIDARRGADIYDASTQALTAATYNTIAFDTESWDSDSYHSTVTNNSRITIPAGLGGMYLVHGGGSITGATASQYRILQNGTASAGDSYVLRNASPGQIMTLLPLSAGDYIELQISPVSVDGTVDDQFFRAIYLRASS